MKKELITIILMVLMFYTLVFSVAHAIEQSVNKDLNKQDQLFKTFLAVVQVESNVTNVTNEDENAVGYAQIRPILLEDVNRIQSEKVFKKANCERLVDCWEMFQIYQMKYAPDGTPEIWARQWNGGPGGENKESTLKYWEKVKVLL